jgi:3-dehydroquinate synthase
METVRVDLGERSYNIFIGHDILGSIGNAVKSLGLSPKMALVSNPTVFSLYGKQVLDSLSKAGLDVITVTIPDGEQFKELRWLQHIFDELLGYRLDRASAIVALGGGVIGDITGFAASTYMRGISYIQIPTTLLAQVDSSVGGKTGVNHALGKNMIGTFWQPRLVLIDTATLNTLPRRELLAGLAEVIKYGVIWDSALFDFLEVNKDSILALGKDALTHIIRRSCEIKAEVVSKDERESGVRAILNYGHTIGHAVETATGYTRYLHGEAVAIGMYLEAMLSHKSDVLVQEHAVRIRDLINSYGLPSELPSGIDINIILSHMQLDKKAVAGQLKFILPENIGTVRIQKGITENILREVLLS